MATYVILNCVFIGALFILTLSDSIKYSPGPRLATLGILLLLTAIFDSFIIEAGIVAYDQAKILGIYIGSAPIEDFFYTFAAVLLVPFVWRRSTKND